VIVAKRVVRRHTTAFILDALARMQRSQNVDKLAPEIGVTRRTLYEWRQKYEAGGEAALNGVSWRRHVAPAYGEDGMAAIDGLPPPKPPRSEWDFRALAGMATTLGERFALESAATEIGRLRSSLAKIARQSPCRTADEMSLFGTCQRL